MITITKKYPEFLNKAKQYINLADSFEVVDIISGTRLDYDTMLWNAVFPTADGGFYTPLQVKNIKYPCNSNVNSIGICFTKQLFNENMFEFTSPTCSYHACLNHSYFTGYNVSFTINGQTFNSQPIRIAEGKPFNLFFEIGCNCKLRIYYNEIKILETIETISFELQSGILTFLQTTELYDIYLHSIVIGQEYSDFLQSIDFNHRIPDTFGNIFKTDGTKRFCSDQTDIPFKNSVQIKQYNFSASCESYTYDNNYSTKIGSDFQGLLFGEHNLGFSAVFDNKSYKIIPYSLQSESLQTNGQYTIMFHAKPNRTGEIEPLIQSSSGDASIYVYFDEQQQVNQIVNSNNIQYKKVSNRIEYDKMSHIAITFNYNTIKLYINGIEVQNQQTSYSKQTEHSNLIIGKYENKYFFGLMQCLQFYNVQLEQTDISNIMENNPNISDTRLVQYYEFGCQLPNKKGTIYSCFGSDESISNLKTLITQQETPHKNIDRKNIIKQLRAGHISCTISPANKTFGIQYKRLSGDFKFNVQGNEFYDNSTDYQNKIYYLKDSTANIFINNFFEFDLYSYFESGTIQEYNPIKYIHRQYLYTDFMNDFTVTGYFKKNLLDASFYKQTIFQFGYLTCNVSNYGIKLFIDDSDKKIKQLINNTVIDVCDQTPYNNKWTSFQFQYDRTHLDVYINNEKKLSQNIFSTFNADILFIGCDPEDSAQYLFEGRLQNVMQYQKFKDEETIKMLVRTPETF